MKAFAYVNPTSEKDAVAALKFDGIAMPLAGGQDLLARMKDEIDSPERIVNVKNALDASITATPDGGLKTRRDEDRGPRRARAVPKFVSRGVARGDRGRHAADRIKDGLWQRESAAAVLVLRNESSSATRRRVPVASP